MKNNFDLPLEPKPPLILWNKLKELGILARHESYENNGRSVHISVPTSCPLWIDIRFAELKTGQELWPVGMVYDQVEIALLSNESGEIFFWYHDDISMDVSYYAPSIEESLQELLASKVVAKWQVQTIDPWDFVRSGFR